MTLAVSHEQLDRFRALIADRLGLFFDDSKLGILADVLRRRTAADHATGKRYLERLATRHGSAAELRQLAQELTVTETYFYRNAEQLTALVDAVLPGRLAERTDGAPVRILCAGCASGDEPYSIAIAVRETWPQAAAAVSIVGVDVNQAMLDKARGGRYSKWALRALPPPLPTRWFRLDRGDWVLDETIRGAVAFEERNLIEDDAELWRARSWDVVFCRNVLMYFDPVRARAAVVRIARSLVPGGFLFLGHAETLRGLSQDFHLCHTHGTFYYRRKGGDTIPTPLDLAAPQSSADAPTLPDVADGAWVETVRRASERIRALTEGSHRSPSPAPSAPELASAKLQDTMGVVPTAGVVW